MKNKKFCIKVYWEMSKEIDVIAKDKESAFEKLEEIPIPKEGKYVMDSFNYDKEDIYEVRERK